MMIGLTEAGSSTLNAGKR